MCSFVHENCERGGDGDGGGRRYIVGQILRYCRLYTLIFCPANVSFCVLAA
jgi:hypothetical protein